MIKSNWIYIFFFMISSILSSCHVARYFYWNTADIKDLNKFPSYEIRSPEDKFYFNIAENQINPGIPEGYQPEKNIDGLHDYLQEQKTVAFLIIRNDTVLFEQYFDGYGKASLLPAFSIAKSVVSALTGIAIDEGYIRTVNDPITNYLEFKNPGFNEITIENLLNMKSGIKFEEGYLNPFSEMAKFYYGRNLEKYVYELKIEGPPGIQYNYQSANPQILSFIIEKTTGLKLTEYLEQKIWIPLGMQFDASWNYDSKKHKNIKSFCCLNARAIDFAKFGKLYLDEGIWQGKRIIPEQWISSTKNADKQFFDQAGYPYHYLWRIKKDGAMFAKGILGQYIYIDPSKNLIIVRIGKKDGEIDWPHFFELLAQQL